MKNFTFRTLSVLLLVCACLSTTRVQGQQVAKSINTANGTIGFLEYKPADYQEKGSYKHPLIIFLHGIGERGNGTTQIQSVANNGVPKSIKNGHNMKFEWNGTTESFIVLSPQLNQSYGFWQNFYTDELIKYAKENLNIDEDRIFLTGLSLGGGGVWYYAGGNESNPKNLAGLVVCCGTCQGVNLCNIANANLPTWAFHAQNDGTVQASCTIGHIYALSNNCNPAVKPYMTIWPDGGHAIWDRVFSTNHDWQNPNVYEWMLGQSRSKAVNQRPIANAGPDIFITTGQATATLNASGSKDNDGKIVRYVWRKISGPAAGSIQQPVNTNGVTTVTGLNQAGTYAYEVKVIDDRADWTFDTVNVVVSTGPVPENKAPVAVVTPEQTIQLPISTIQLDASGSYDSDGQIVAYSWSYVSGPSQYSLGNSNQAKATLSNVVAGSYIFRVTVTDNGGATHSATTKINFLAAPNIAPQAVIQPVNPTITLPQNSVQLDGTKSSDDDGSITAYEWKKVSGPDQYQITHPNDPFTAIQQLVAGTYIFSLTVTDNSGEKNTAQVTIEVLAPANTLPVAVAGQDITITAPNHQVTLNGSNSYDSDGTIIRYQWEKLSGPDQYNITTAENAITTISNLVPGIYVFRLTVTDDRDGQHSDEVTITVQEPAPNALPVIVLNDSYSIRLPDDQITIDASGSYDSDGTIISFIWSQLSGRNDYILDNSIPDQLTLSQLKAGTYEFKLEITDDRNGKTQKIFTIKVEAAPVEDNHPPVAHAGENQILPENSGIILLNASRSSDPDGDELQFEWTYFNGPSQYQLAKSNEAVAEFSDYNIGTYAFLLKVTDPHGLYAYDTLHITIYPLHNPTDNYLPIAIAGNDTTLTLPANSLLLDASQSYDPYGEVKAYQWSKVSGPEAYHLENADAAIASLSNLVAGVYQFKVRVWGDEWESTNDTIQITVLPEPNHPPVANAGATQTIKLPVNSVSLNGTQSTDPNGTDDIILYQWSKISGGNAVIVNSAAAVTAVNALEAGSYSFELLVTDKGGLSDRDTVTIIVQPFDNRAPVAQAGNDQYIRLPVNAVVLNGSASYDPDEENISTLQFEWTVLDAENEITIVSPHAATTSVQNLQAGIYTFVLKVSDAGGLSDTDTVTVTVLPPANQPPVAVAGEDITITLPVSQVTVNGNGSYDPDGNHTITGYHWKYFSGPAGASIAQPNNAQTIISQLEEGTYQFVLTVSDTANATATDTIQVTVLPRVLVPPVANAGQDVTITLPVNTVSLNGTASHDPDDNAAVLQYSWKVIQATGHYVLQDPQSAVTSLTQLEEGIYQVELTVEDADALTDKDTIRITVKSVPNKAPVAITGSNFTINMDFTVFELDGSASYDPDGENTIASAVWSQVSGPNSAVITQKANKMAEVTGFTEGVYVFRFTITDDKGASASATTQVTVQPKPAPTNQLPVAVAGNAQQITLPTNSINLNGSLSYDPDGEIVSYHWTRVSGPTQFTLQDPHSAITRLSNLTEGTYVFRLTVTDNSNAIGSAQVTIRVLPAPNVLPIANAGNNQTIYLPTNKAQLNGSSSNDPDGTIVQYQWEKIAGPASFNIVNAAAVSTDVNNLVQGTYTFRLTVTDNAGGTNSAQVSVTVLPDPNRPPVANAGDDITTRLPVNGVLLNGDNSYDPDGDDISFKWQQVSGPSTALIIYDNIASPYASRLVVGEYIFRLTVTDVKGLSSSDNMKVTVLPATNIAPVAVAGQDTVLYEPNTSLILNGSRSRDMDGQIVSYEWKQISGELSNILQPQNVITMVTQLKAGDYTYELRVTDDRGDHGLDTIHVHVLPDPNSKGFIHVYPSPVYSGELTIDLKSKELGKGILNVYASDGKIVHKEFIEISSYNSQWKIPVDRLIKGVYTVELTIPQKFRLSKQFMKL